MGPSRVVVPGMRNSAWTPNLRIRSAGSQGSTVAGFPSIPYLHASCLPESELSAARVMVPNLAAGANVKMCEDQVIWIWEAVVAVVL